MQWHGELKSHKVIVLVLEKRCGDVKAKTALQPLLVRVCKSSARTSYYIVECANFHTVFLRTEYDSCTWLEIESA